MMSRIKSALLMVLATNCLNAVFAKESLSVRLPKIVKPDFYKLDITPDIDKAKFNGFETINVEITQATNKIKLNSKEIKIISANIVHNDISCDLTVSYDESAQICELTSKEDLKPGKYSLKIEFEGILNNKLRGFYLSTYKDENKVERRIATTQMEPADARRMFPCFDEPDFKAQFQITAHIAPDMVAISNNYVQKKYRDKDNKLVYEFAPTPKMSTYLVALIVGPFESTSSLVKDGCDIKVWTIKGKVKLANYAQSQAAKLLEYYNKYFNINYPLKKLDLIAIPDFEAGAMENLGAITYREADLLVDEKTGSSDNKQGITSIIAHEMAHMWFGDMVTMSWWDDLWLNEAFATWMSHKAVDNIEPSWEFYYNYITERLYAMRYDSLHCSRPIHASVSGPDQAQEMFDSITYSKGSSVLKMIESYIGENDFRRGINNYLKEHLYSNATTQDLWNSLTQASEKPVNELAPTFVNQPGYPLVTFNLTKDNRMIVNQKQFYYYDLPDSKSDRKWLIPLKIKSMESNNKKNYDKDLTEIVNLDTQELQNYHVFEPFKANVNGFGYYRSVYPDNNFNLLAKNNLKLLSPAERITLMNDEWNLVKSLNTNFDNFISLLDNYKLEKNTYVVKEFIGSLYRLASFVDKSQLDNFAKYSNNLLQNVLTVYGTENKPNDTMLVRSVRTSLVTFLGTYGQNKQIIAEARNYLNKNLFEKYNKDIDGDKLKSYLRIVAYNGDAKDYDSIFNCYQNAQTPEIEIDCLYSLPSFRDKELISKTLDLCLTDKIRTQDSPHIIAYFFANKFGSDLALNFFENNYDDLVKKLPPMSMPHIIQSMGRFTKKEQLTSVKDFFATHKVKVGKQALRESLEMIEANVRFDEKNSEKISSWIQSQK